MTSEVFKSLEQAFKEAEAYLKGEHTGAITHEIKVPLDAQKQYPARTILTKPLTTRKPRH